MNMQSWKAQLITLPPEWWKAFKRAAEEKGQSLSAWIGEAGKRKLPPEVRDALPAPVRPGRPSKKSVSGKAKRPKKTG
jgi:hypothetical protein